MGGRSFHQLLLLDRYSVKLTADPFRIPEGVLLLLRLEIGMKCHTGLGSDKEITAAPVSTF